MDLIQLAVSGLLIGGLYALLTVPLNMIFGVTRIVHFAYGDFLMLAMFGGYWLWALYALDPYGISPLLMMLLFIPVGLLLYKLLFRRLALASHMTQIMATLGLAFALQNTALLMWTADVRSVRSPYSILSLAVGDIRISVPHLVAFLVGVIGSVVVLLFLRRSRWGFAMRAVTQERLAAKVVGIPIDHTYRLTVVMSTAMLGLVGVIMLPVFFVFPGVGLEFVVVAFVLVVLGGLGSFLGGIVAGFIIGLTQVFSAYFIGIQWQTVTYFIVFLIVLAVRPAGLFGVRGTEELGV